MEECMRTPSKTPEDVTDLVPLEESSEEKASSAEPPLKPNRQELIVPGEEAPTVNPALLYLAQLHSENSIATMRSRLNSFARWTGAESLMDCNWSELRAEHIIAYMRHLATSSYTKRRRNAGTGKVETEVVRHAGSSVNGHLAALRGVARAAWIAGVIEEGTYRKLLAVKQVRYSRLPAGRALARKETTALIEALPEESNSSLRDRAILYLMFGCGLRRAEIPFIRIENYDRNDRTLTLVGKGDKERRVFLPSVVADAVNNWIDDVRGEEPGFLFCRFWKGGSFNVARAMSPRAISLILEKALELAGIAEPTAPHDLRRTFASRLMDRNIDITTIQKLMGHASITTTAKYDRRGEDNQRAAMEEI